MMLLQWAIPGREQAASRFSLNGYENPFYANQKIITEFKETFDHLRAPVFWTTLSVWYITSFVDHKPLDEEAFDALIRHIDRTGNTKLTDIFSSWNMLDLIRRAASWMWDAVWETPEDCTPAVVFSKYYKPILKTQLTLFYGKKQHLESSDALFTFIKSPSNEYFRAQILKLAATYAVFLIDHDSDATKPYSKFYLSNSLGETIAPFSRICRKIIELGNRNSVPFCMSADVSCSANVRAERRRTMSMPLSPHIDRPDPVDTPERQLRKLQYLSCDGETMWMDVPQYLPLVARQASACTLRNIDRSLVQRPDEETSNYLTSEFPGVRGFTSLRVFIDAFNNENAREFHDVMLARRRRYQYIGRSPRELLSRRRTSDI